MNNSAAQQENLYNNNHTDNKNQESIIKKLQNDQNILEFCIKGFELKKDELKGKNLILIIGKTGAGKSTVINYLNGANFRESSTEPGVFEIIPG